MDTIRTQDLSLEAFLPFGTFSNLINPTGVGSGNVPVSFIRDIVQQQLGGTDTSSYSICRVEARPAVINFAEYHNRCCEGILPLDNDILIHVAAATHPMASVPTDKFEVFRVPQGTMVVLRPGVWHGAPYTANAKPANVLVVLPERTYANDCVVARLSEEQQVAFAD